MSTTATDSQILTLAQSLRALLAEHINSGHGFLTAVPDAQSPTALLAALDAIITALGG